MSNIKKASQSKKIKKSTNQITQSEPKSQNKDLKDKRFMKAQYDPSFMKPNSKSIKTKIDKRFAKMMTDSSFKTGSAVDRYGREVDQNQDNEQLQDYYYMEEQHPLVEEKNEIQEEESISKEQGIRDWMQNYNQQSSQEEDEQEQQQQSQQEQIWQQKVQSKTISQATSRLALCNYDWMSISSKDLMILFNSFKPSTGYIKSVQVFKSNIGKIKMQEENQVGPKSLWENQEEEIEEQVTKSKNSKRKSWKNLLMDKKDEEANINNKNLRKYEKQRLKYFYAVINCDSVKTADQIYASCQGNSFENSNLPFDLSFIPSDLKLPSQNVTDECNDLPLSGQVKNAMNRAAGHSNVSLTWQDPELSMAANLKKMNWSKMTDKQLDQVDWGMYVDEDDLVEDQQRKQLFGRNTSGGGEDEDSEEYVADWKKQCNKKYRKKDDDIQISFGNSFGTKKVQNPAQFPSLKSQKKTFNQKKRESIKKQKQRKINNQGLDLIIDSTAAKRQEDFKVNLGDERFPAVYNNPHFSIDPTSSQFDHRKSGKVFEQVVKRNKAKNNE